MQRLIPRINRPSMNAGAVWKVVSSHRPTYRKIKEDRTSMKLHALNMTI